MSALTWRRSPHGTGLQGSRGGVVLALVQRAPHPQDAGQWQVVVRNLPGARVPGRGLYPTAAAARDGAEAIFAAWLVRLHLTAADDGPSGAP